MEKKTEIWVTVELHFLYDLFKRLRKEKLGYDDALMWLIDNSKQVNKANNNLE